MSLGRVAGALGVGLITGFYVNLLGGPSWAVLGFTMTVFNVVLWSKS